MNIQRHIFALLFLIGTWSTSHAQFECILLPDTIFNCGFSLDVEASIGPGDWQYFCEDGPGEVSTDEFQIGSFTLTFSECGTYLLTYSSYECEEVKEVVFLIDDPSFTETKIVNDNSLDYLPYVCHESASSCDNEVSISGEVPPDPEWELCYFATCEYTHYLTAAGTPISADGCIVEDIAITMFSSSDSTEGCESTDQTTFVDIDPVTGEVIDITFCEYIASQFATTLTQLDCPAAPASCFAIDESCIDSVSYDTITYDFPIHDGGRWTMLEGIDTIILMDTTNVFKYGRDLLFIIEPGADYYGPGDLTFTLLELIGGDTFPTTFDAEFTLWWQELWHYETIEEIITVNHYSDDPACQSCGGNSLSSSKNIPEIPDFNCSPITIGFGSPCSCEIVEVEIVGNSFVDCYEPCTDLIGSYVFVDPNITVSSEEWTNENGDVIGSGSILTVCNTGQYTYTVITTNGCEFSTALHVDQDFQQPYGEAGGPYVIDCFDECVIVQLELSIFNQEVNIDCTDPFGNTTNVGQIFEACIPGEYLIELFDIVNGCTSEFTFVVEEYLEPVDFVIEAPDDIVCGNCVTLLPELIDVPSSALYTWVGSNGFVSNELFPIVCEAGTYTLTIEYGNCNATQSVTVIESAQPVAITISEEICNGDCVEIGSEIYCESGSYEVAGMCDTMFYIDILVTESQTFIKYEAMCQGEQVEVDGVVYYDAISTIYPLDNGTACPDIVELTIDVFDIDIQIMGETSIDCDNEEASMQVFSNDADALFYWYNSNGTLLSQSSVFNTNIAGNYTVSSVGSISQCTAEQSFTIIDNSDYPDVEINGSYSFNCVSQIQIQLDVNSGANLEYLWTGPGIEASQTSVQNPVVTEAGLYTVQVKNEFGCISGTDVLIEQVETLDFAAIPTTTCSNTNTGRIEVKAAGGAGPFMYRIDNSAWQADPVFENLGPDEYEIGILQHDGCEDMKMVDVESIPEIEPSIIVDQEYELCDVPELTFNLEDDLVMHDDWNIVWQDGSSAVERTFTEAGNYSLEISNECETREYFFEVADSRLQDELPIYIANVFTPNNDGINDLFELHAAELPSEFSIEIYDRWGTRVFESDDIHKSWDGIVQAGGGKTGVYAYIARYSYLECEDKEKDFEIIGDVTLMR